MSQESYNIEPIIPKRRLANISLRFKLYFGLGILLAGLLLISGSTIYANLTTQWLVNRDLIHQRQLADLAANITNNLLNIQNQVFEFHDTWTVTGFERDGFDQAKEIYLNPIQEQLEQIRVNAAEIQQLEPDLETRVRLERILSSVDGYETTLLDMSDQMESLGYRETGYFGQLEQIFTTLQNQLPETGMDALKTTLFQINQYAKSFFLHSELRYTRLVAESIQLLGEQITATDDARLPPADKAVLNDLSARYYDHFLAAASQHRKLLGNRILLTNYSDPIDKLVRQFFEQQQTEFSLNVERLQRQQSGTIATTLGLTLVILLIGSAIAYFIAQQTIRPIQTLGETAERLGAGELDVRVPFRGRDEIGTTATAFNATAERLQNLLSELEQRVADRTRDLEATTTNLAARTAELERAHQLQMEANRQLEETVHQSQRRAAMLQASAQVSRAVTEIRDLDQLLTQVTQLISQHFGFYHAGIFLIDQAGLYAVLRASNSQGGQRMLARHHRLAVGSEGIVGYVTGTGQPRIALDVGVDATFFDNPDLPDTRSEMAVPLGVGNEIIGALDVQSTEEAAFEEEDVRVLVALADQISIAIHNIYLFRQSEVALEEAQLAQRRYLQQEWSRFTQRQQVRAHEFTLSGVSSIGDILPPEAQEAWLKGELVTAVGDGGDATRTALAVPIKVRGETIGILDLQEIESERVWSDDEIAIVQAVADQLGQALDGARLFEETQSRARREALTRQITERVRAAGATGDIQAILQTTAEELGQALGVTRSIAHLSLPKAPTSEKDT